MKRIITLTLLALLMLFFGNQIQAESNFSELPSESTLNEINETYSPSYSTRDWWGEGPPTEGNGGGGAVGIPLGDGLLPLMLGGLTYLMFIGIRRRKTTREN